MDEGPELVNEVDPTLDGSEGRRNERATRSEAECRRRLGGDDARLPSETVVEEGGCGVGFSSSPSPSPSFLVYSNDHNVNGRLRRARCLMTKWEFLAHKGRIGRTYVLLALKKDPGTVRIMPVKCRSRYFGDGRLYISRKIRKRLGRYERVPGLMETLTYDPKKIGKAEAWASFGKDTRRFLNAVNQYRKRRGWRRTHYLWVVEVQPGTGYPHVHIFFPSLRYLAPLKVLSGNWRRGRANVEPPRKIKLNCAGYISKYLRKMEGWEDEHLMLLWNGGCRMYSFSRGFSAKVEKTESEWQRVRVLQTEDVEWLEMRLERSGCVIDRSCQRGRGESGSAGSASGSQAITQSGDLSCNQGRGLSSLSGQEV